MQIKQHTPDSGSVRFVVDPETVERNTVVPVNRYYSADADTLGDVLNEPEWVTADVEISGAFRQEGVRHPDDWSKESVQIVASKYFRGHGAAREQGIDDLIRRVVVSIADAGLDQGYLDQHSRQVFGAELGAILLRQYAAFNSPVWFNVGVEQYPQASACFITTIEDSMQSIMEWVATESLIFKGGSGSGTNVSNIRPAGTLLSGSGKASGPLSFMRVADVSAGAIKSGGKTRRAAKMVILDEDHADIEAFIACKADEEKKAQALIAAGFDSNFNGAAYSTVAFQNANHSVRFKGPLSDPRRSDLLAQAAESAWTSGCPGVQFDDLINAMNPVSATQRINASNPCSEYMFVDDSACNLASINLLPFCGDQYGEFDVEGFTHVVDIMTLAMEILVGMAGYPTRKIAQNSHDYRPLGLGFANLGACLMQWAVPYDSDQGRDFAGAVTALMGGQAYGRSAELALAAGPFPGYQANQESVENVMWEHHNAAERLSRRLSVRPGGGQLEPVLTAAVDAWSRVVAATGSDGHGIRNAQATVLAPTGTIAFMMGCDTTGIEPEIALVRTKFLAGGGTLQLASRSVEPALRRLGIGEPKVQALLATLETAGASAMRDALDEVLAGAFDRLRAQQVFDTALPDASGRSISWEGHLRMMGACQPFLSGAISKTVNMPNDATPGDIERAYRMAYDLGLKAVAVYRDGSKWSQPVESDDKASPEEPNEAPVFPVQRERLPDDRRSITHKFSISGHEGYLTLGFYPDGRPGELFVRMSKEGSTLGGLLDAFATAVSLCLQYGAPVGHLVEKFRGTRFEPAGFTGRTDIRSASSVIDYIAQWLELKTIEAASDIIRKAVDVESPEVSPSVQESAPAVPTGEACPVCGTMMVRSGTCHTCPNCGYSGGCG